MVSDVLIRGTTGWRSMYAGSAEDIRGAKPDLSFVNIVGQIDPIAEQKFIRNAANNDWIPLDVFVPRPEIRAYDIKGFNSFNLDFVSLSGEIGDLLFCECFTSDGSIQTPLGWVRIVNQTSGGRWQTRGFYKIATTTAEAITIFNSGGTNVAGAYVRFSGNSGILPLADEEVSDSNGGGFLVVPGLNPPTAPNISVIQFASDTLSPGHIVDNYTKIDEIANGTLHCAVSLWTRDFETGGPVDDILIENRASFVQGLSAGHLCVEPQ